MKEIRDLAKDFRDYADAPMKGTPFVPIHRDTLLEAADALDNLRADLALVTAGRDDFCRALTPRRWTFGQLTAWRRNSQDHEKAFAALLLETVMPGSQDD